MRSGVESGWKVLIAIWLGCMVEVCGAWGECEEPVPKEQCRRNKAGLNHRGGNKTGLNHRGGNKTGLNHGWKQDRLEAPGWKQDRLEAPGWEQDRLEARVGNKTGLKHGLESQGGIRLVLVWF